MEPQQALRAFYEEIKDCQKCPLAASRTQVVFGSGNPRAEVMLIGEAPGYHEDRQGKPFVGAAGRLLDQLLHEAGLRRADVYIANVVKCRPPQNRTPRPEEIAACQPYLWRQLEIIRPRVVCTLGNVATQLLLGKKVGIMKVRGQPFPVRWFVVVPMLHPAAALHREALQAAVREDFQRLRALLAQGLQPPAAEQMPLL
ncbi:MAG: uracil-DNA glycosylase [Candidatus Tectimicrobiota bacterium]|nr:MAG: uracil-DNA glycosylase [Candidatus Tectomicrobia bacterium]